MREKAMENSAKRPEAPWREGEAERYLKRAIREFILKSPDNRLHLIDGEPLFEEPLVAFAQGRDPLFEELKRIIGPFHLTPKELLKEAIEDGLCPEDAGHGLESMSVISWVLPVAQGVRKANRRVRKFPARKWAHQRNFGELLNEKLREHVVGLLRGAGFAAIAPMQSPYFKRVNDERVGIASTWSERHVAFVAGLGTFGYCDGLITPRGKAQRVGSVVTSLPLRATPRPYESHTEWCLHFRGMECRQCEKRCPAGAFDERGHSKPACKRWVQEVIFNKFKDIYGVKAMGCGICQVSVPCEAEVPPETLSSSLDLSVYR
ncbi:MAG: hypothetical protein ACE5LX_00370 [Nitrospinota bacterium]